MYDDHSACKIDRAGTGFFKSGVPAAPSLEVVGDGLARVERVDAVMADARVARPICTELASSLKMVVTTADDATTGTGTTDILIISLLLGAGRWECLLFFKTVYYIITKRNTWLVYSSIHTKSKTKAKKNKEKPHKITKTNKKHEKLSRG